MDVILLVGAAAVGPVLGKAGNEQTLLAVEVREPGGRTGNRRFFSLREAENITHSSR